MAGCLRHREQQCTDDPLTNRAFQSRHVWIAWRFARCLSQRPSLFNLFCKWVAHRLVLPRDDNVRTLFKYFLLSDPFCCNYNDQAVLSSVPFFDILTLFFVSFVRADAIGSLTISSHKVFLEG